MNEETNLAETVNTSAPTGFVEFELLLYSMNVLLFHKISGIQQATENSIPTNQELRELLPASYTTDFIGLCYILF